MSDIIYDVIMLSHNQTDLTVACVDSLAGMDEADQARLIWVDNGSGPAHCMKVDETIAKHGLNSKQYWHHENFGFPKAVNLGIALSTAPYVVFLNDDVVLQSGVFDTMRKAIEITDKAMLACTVSTSGWQAQTQLARRGWLDRDYKPAVSTPRILERAEHPAFFCTMVTRECIQKIGYLSEEMQEGFGEDDDYNERIHAAGYKRLICLDAFVEHKHRSTWKAIKTDREIRDSQQQSMDVLQKKYGAKVW